MMAMGKLLQQLENDTHNFDSDEPLVSPLTSEWIGSWYKPGETSLSNSKIPLRALMSVVRSVLEHVS